METIEKLTDEERAYIQGFRVPEATKALRIIDQLTAALEATRNQRNDAQALLERNMVASRARAEALQARVAELEAENAELKARIAGPTDVKQALTLTAANAKIDKLVARVAELEAEKEHAVKCAAEAELRFEDAVKVAMGRASAETVAGLREESATRLAYSEQWRSEALAARTKLDAREAELATAKARVAELEAECERLRALGDETYDRLMASSDRQSARAAAAEAELADLRGRVERALEVLECLGAPIWMPAAARRALEALRGR